MLHSWATKFKRNLRYNNKMIRNFFLDFMHKVNKKVIQHHSRKKKISSNQLYNFYSSSSTLTEKFRQIVIRFVSCSLNCGHHNHHNVEKREIYSYRKKFREINSIVNLLGRTLVSRNFHQKCVRVNFRNFHILTTNDNLLFFEENFVKTSIRSSSVK